MTFRNMTFGRYDYAAFLTFFSYAAGSIVIPVALVDIARDLGFSLESGGMTLGGVLHLTRSVTIVIAMLLCGFAAARWGKKLSLIVSLLLMALGLMLCAIAPTYGILLLALSVTGLGEGVIEGLATPFIQDLHPQDSGKYINFSHSFWSVGVFVAVIGAGFLVSVGVSWRWPVLVVVMFSLIAAALLLAPPQKGEHFHEPLASSGWKETAREFKKISQIPRFWVFFWAMFLAGGAEFCITFWVASYIQLTLEQSAWIAGLGTATFAVGMFLGRTVWGVLINQKQLKSLVFYSSLGGIVASLFLPSQNELWSLFVLLFFCGVATAPLWPSIQSYSADCLPSVKSTELFILLSCAGVPGAGVFTMLMGYLGNASGDLRMAFYLVPVCFLILSLIIGIDAFIARRQSDDVSGAEQAREPV